MNILALLVAAIVPLVVGWIWYHPAVFGTIWMLQTGMTPEKARGSNIFVLMGVSLIMSFLISVIVSANVIHQMGATSLVGGDPSKALVSYQAFMADYGTAFRTFKHGLLHGLILGLLFVLPIITINALFEKRSYKYVLITAGYWIVSLTLMGGIICAWK